MGRPYTCPRWERGMRVFPGATHAAAAQNRATGRRVQRVSGFEPVWLQSKHLMVQRFEVDDHRSALSG
jgi:hypothetical protein